MSGTDRLPDYLLERLAAGDLSDAEQASARARLAAEPGGLERLPALWRRDAEEVRSLPPAPRPALREAPAPARAPWALVVPFAMALLVAGIWSLGRPPGQEDGERVKGLAPRIVLHRQGAAGAERLPDGATARPGDLLQLGYVSAGRAYGAIVSIDGRGGVTLHLPRSGAEAAPLPPAGGALLPESFRLDDATRFERFFLVTAAEPFPVAPLLEAARALASRPDAAAAPLFPGGAREVASVLVRKESP